SLQKGLLQNDEYHEIKKTIFDIFDKVIFEDNDIQPILDLLIHDKKNEYGTVQFALLDGIGKIKINQSADNEWIINSFEDYKR
ncbi:MAG: 3-dehydroquinate synthase, partial [Flavobacterium sp.]|nr:3-dehydroquinate synthase [Flavobacterium sp.]